MTQAIATGYAPTAGSAPHSNSPRHRFYRRVLRALNAAGIDFVIGGGYALERHLGIGRPTKDLDLFLRPADVKAALGHFRSIGFDAELTFPHWLAKVTRRDDQVDLIFNGGNGICPVDDDWFRYAIPARVLGVPVKLSPVEEMIWSKAFVMERERYDGADIAHLILRQGDRLDWSRLLRRFGPDWRVLMSYLVMFGYVYPSERARVPQRVVNDLTQRLRDEAETPPPAEKVCGGTVVSRLQYLPDVNDWGFRDVRHDSRVHMSDSDIALWTRAALAQGDKE